MTKARDLANASTALSAVSATELGYVDGVTSAIQTQLDAKAPSSTAVTLTGTQTLTNKTLTSPALTTPTISTATTNGDILYGTGSGALARLGIGTTGQVLNVASGLPAWATPASGSTYVGCSSYKTSGQTLTANAYTAITWQDEYWDTDAFHSSATNPSRFTVPAGKAGKYAYKFNLGIGSTAGDVYFHVRVNGTTYWNYSWDTNSPTNLQGNVTVNMAVGDYLELFVYFISAITTASYSEAICSFDYLGA